MNRPAVALLLTALILGNCTLAPASSTPPAPATAAQSVSPSETPLPTSTVRPIPVFQTQKHLLVTRDHEHWAALNADGSLQKYVQIPSLADPSDVSPDGNWVVYEFGSYEGEPYDLSLNLLNLDNGTSQFVTNLLSPDFPENIEPIVESMSQYDQSLYGDDCISHECRRSLVEAELLSTFGKSKWSPDGQLLAFTAQIDGPSTEIYIYDTQDKIIQRLTNDLQNVEWIEWSPDGKRILYTNDIPGIVHAGRTFHVTDLEGRTFQLSQEILTKAPQWYMHGWITDNLYLLQANYPEPGQWHSRQLLVANAENGQLTEIWPYPTSDVVIDTDNQTIILSFYQFFFEDPIPNAPEPGTYFISTKGDRKKISDQTFSLLTSSSQIIGIEDWIAYHILDDGSIKRIGPADWDLTNSSSPDQKWFIIYERDSYNELYRLSLYDDIYQKLKSWTFNEDVVATTWRPDSLGIFLFTEDNIYYLAIPDGEPGLLDVEIPPIFEDCNDIACLWPSFAWLP